MNEEFGERKRKYQVSISFFIDIERNPKSYFQLSIRVSDGPGKFWRTNVVTIRPRFIFVNNFPDKIFYRQHGLYPYILKLHLLSH